MKSTYESVSRMKDSLKASQKIQSYSRGIGLFPPSMYISEKKRPVCPISHSQDVSQTGKQEIHPALQQNISASIILNWNTKAPVEYHSVAGMIIMTMPVPTGYHAVVTMKKTETPLCWKLVGRLGVGCKIKDRAEKKKKDHVQCVKYQLCYRTYQWCRRTTYVYILKSIKLQS